MLQLHISQNTRLGLDMLGISKGNQTFWREVKIPQLQPSIVFQKSHCLTLYINMVATECPLTFWKESLLTKNSHIITDYDFWTVINVIKLL